MTKIHLCAAAALFAACVVLRPSAPADDIAAYRAQLHQSNSALQAALNSGNADLNQANALLADISSTFEHDPTARFNF